jgi:triacylglycerol lipase
MRPNPRLAPRFPTAMSAEHRQLHSRPNPVLRWLSNPSSTSDVRPSLPPSPSLLALQEALNEDLELPTTPPQAHLPPAFCSSRSLTPPFFDNLTRSTLPTASITRYSSNLRSELPKPVLSSSTRQSSVDSLLSVSERGVHTTPSARIAASLSRGWWFQSENKENVDTLLSEDDRGDTVEQEQANIRRKCTLITLVPSSFC